MKPLLEIKQKRIHLRLLHPVPGARKQVHGLCALQPPVPLESVLVRIFWSARLANDAGSIWIRSIVIETYRKLQAEAETKLAKENLIRPGLSFRS